MSDLQECLKRRRLGESITEGSDYSKRWDQLTKKTTTDTTREVKDLRTALKDFAKIEASLKKLEKAEYIEDYKEAYDLMIKIANSLSSRLSELSTNWSEYRDEISDFH